MICFCVRLSHCLGSYGQGLLPSLLEPRVPTAWLGPPQGPWDQTNRANGRSRACGSAPLHEALSGAPKPSFHRIRIPEGSAASPNRGCDTWSPVCQGLRQDGAARLPRDLFPGLSPNSLTLTMAVAGWRYLPNDREPHFTARLAREGSVQPLRLRTAAAWKAPHVQAPQSRPRWFPAMNWASESEPPARLRAARGPRRAGGGCTPKSGPLARIPSRSGPSAR